jgi:hypothetical protein
MAQEIMVLAKLREFVPFSLKKEQCRKAGFPSGMILSCWKGSKALSLRLSS